MRLWRVKMLRKNRLFDCLIGRDANIYGVVTSDTILFKYMRQVELVVFHGGASGRLCLLMVDGRGTITACVERLYHFFYLIV